MAVIELGNIISGTIDRISNSGSGILDYGEGEIRIGPVKQEAVGKRVNAMIRNKNLALCLSASARKEHYRNIFKAMAGELRSDPPDDCPSPGEVITASVGRPNSSGHTHGRFKGLPVRVRHIFATERNLSKDDTAKVKVIRVEEGRIVASAILSLEVRNRLPEVGEEFTAVVAHRSHSGRGLVESFPPTTVNVGPIKEDVIGRRIEAVMVREGFAYCLSEDATPGDYDEKMKVHLEDEVAQSSMRLFESLTQGVTIEREQKRTSTTGGYRRDPSFSRNVKDAYDHACAICGAERTAPNGSSEVEAAHIYPVSGADSDEEQGGPDEIGNGIALCRMHHWAFDNGWFAIEDDYTITVRDRPDLPGYAEIAEYDGEQIRLPDEEEHCPKVEFIRAHRLRIWS